MKKNKHLFRAWIWSSIVLVFTSTLSAALSFRYSKVLSWVMIAVSVVALAALIVAQVFYKKNRKLFPILGLCSQGLSTLVILYSLVIESILTAMGYPAVYAWVILGIGAVLQALILYATITIVIKIIRGEAIIEGKQ